MISLIHFRRMVINVGFAFLLKDNSSKKAKAGASLLFKEYSQLHLGQVVLGYGENGSINYCGIGGGNMSCVKANIGDSDGNDFYLDAQINMCDF